MLFEVTGLKETLEILKTLEQEIGDKEAKSKVLVPAIKEALEPVLSMAKATAPKDTGLLANSLTIDGRRPTKRDRRSRYVHPTDSVIGIVTTKPIPKRLKNKISQLYPLAQPKHYKSLRRHFYEQHGIPYDARAIAMEFGTAKISAQPFMRNALESQAQSVSTKLGEIIRKKIEQYRSKKI